MDHQVLTNILATIGTVTVLVATGVSTLALILYLAGGSIKIKLTAENLDEWM